MARAASRKTSKRTMKRKTMKRKTMKRAKPMKRRTMKRMATECSRIPAAQCERVNPNCQSRKVKGRKTKICVRRSGVAKGQMYEGPSMPMM